MATAPIFIGSYRNGRISLIAGYDVRPRLAFTAGANGSRIHLIHAVSSDAGINNVTVSVGMVTTLGSAMGVGTFVDGGGGSDTITRTTGSFVDDGWKVGDVLISQGATTLTNDFLGILTGVAATTLTFATATIGAGEVLLSTTKLYRSNVLSIQAVAATAGTDPAVPAHNFLNNTSIPGLDASPYRYLTLGPSEGIFFAAGTLLGAAEIINIIVSGGDY